MTIRDWPGIRRSGLNRKWRVVIGDGYEKVNVRVSVSVRARGRGGKVEFCACIRLRNGAERLSPGQKTDPLPKRLKLVAGQEFQTQHHFMLSVRVG